MGARRGEVRQSVLLTILTRQRRLETNKHVVAKRTVESYLQATNVWNPNDPVPMEVDAVKTRGNGKKGKDTAKGKGKGKSCGKGKDKGQTPKCKGGTSGHDRTLYSCARRGHSSKYCETYGVSEVQLSRQHLLGLSLGQAHPSLLLAQNTFAQTSLSTMTVPSEASTMQGVNHFSNAAILECRSSSQNNPIISRDRDAGSVSVDSAWVELETHSDPQRDPSPCASAFPIAAESGPVPMSMPSVKGPATKEE